MNRDPEVGLAVAETAEAVAVQSVSSLPPTHLSSSATIAVGIIHPGQVCQARLSLNSFGRRFFEDLGHSERQELKTDFAISCDVCRR